MPPPDDDTISADRTAIEAANDTFNDLAQQFENTIEPLGAAYDSLAAGAASLWSDMSTGASQFLLGWRETLQACGETSGIIAGNVGNYWLDLSAVDVDTSITIDLTPPG